MPHSRLTTAAIDPHKARLALIEDDVLLSDLLCMALRLRLKPADLRLFSQGRAGIDFCRASKPDLLIVDLGLPDMDGREVIRAIHAVSPETRIMVLTGQVTQSLPAQLLALGVSGYVDKGSSLEHAEAAVKRVLDGGIYFSTGAAPAPKRNAAGSASWDGPPPEVLTEREREIVRLVAGGLISKEIAVRLTLSPRTVEKARAQILGKLRLRDLPELVRWSVKHGLA